MACPAVSGCIFFYMAGYTPAHFQRADLAHFWHGLNSSMTLCTIQSFFYMAFMTKVNKIRKIVDFGPLYGCFGFPVFCQNLNLWTILFYIFMAFHAGSNRGNPCMYGFICVSMAMVASNIKISGVNYMVECNGLLSFLAVFVPAVRIGSTSQKEKAEKKYNA